MGCLQAISKSTQGESRPVIKADTGKFQQGVSELKDNYVINSKTRVLGAGQFGRVFQTWRKNDETA